MSKILSIISGKGGAGKTAIALSITSLLSDCGCKVLLIDADISTNGATYFYEEKLGSSGKNISSFVNLFIGKKDVNCECLVHLNDHADFIPSLNQISDNNIEGYRFKIDDKKDAAKLCEELKNKYDVIIFDFQAGYSDTMKMILPVSDILLAVMEADAISSSALRSLYIKISKIINDKKIYQVFNKATDEEYEIYSKVSGGTIFTNIETIKFDWSIRKAFSLAEIPDMKSTSANYGEQIYNICSVLFKENNILEKIESYKNYIKAVKDAEMEYHYQRLVKDNIRNKRKLVSVWLIIITMLLFIFTLVASMEGMQFFIDNDTLLIVTSIIAATFALLMSVYVTREINSKKEELQLKNLERDIQKMQRQLLKDWGKDA